MPLLHDSHYWPEWQTTTFLDNRRGIHTTNFTFNGISWNVTTSTLTINRKWTPLCLQLCY